MKTLYFDCAMGAAGDMLTAALLELFPNQEEILRELNSIGIPHVVFCAESSVKCGITGTHMVVKVHGHEEGEEHSHHHEHHEHFHDEHEHVHHSHHHSSLGDISALIENLKVDDSVRKDVLSVYNLIAEAESHAHGVPVEQIHFHEVGTLDAVADVTAVCYLMHKLAPEQIIASPVHVGAGTVKCAHGILPVPAPATAFILKDVPIYGGSIQSELCTPTGAALLKYFVHSFGDMPAIKTEKIGYGMGKKDFSAANCVRTILGQTQGMPVFALCCNLDDMTGEEIGFAVEQLCGAGAMDVFTTPIGMKKSRPGILLTVICKASDRELMIENIFKFTTTLGIRQTVQTLYNR